jgi:hypothetical protein
MKHKVIGAIVVLLLASVVFTWQVGASPSKLNTNAQPALTCNAQEHYKWALQSLTEMRKVQVGMTRADVLKVFCEEGGGSTITERTYVYRKFHFFKVDVSFSPTHPTYDEEGRLSCDENPRDIVKEISKPYLECEHFN